MTDANTIPETIEYQDSFADQVKQAKRTKFKTPRAGWMRLVVNKGFKRDQTSKGNLRVTRRVSPVDAGGNKVDGGTTKLELYPPVPNPSVKGHQPPNTTFGNYCLARAMGEEKEVDGTKCVVWGEHTIPLYPHQDKDKFLDANGEPIDEDTYKQLRRQTNIAVGKFAVHLYNKPEDMDREVLFGLIEHETGKDGNTYTRVKYTRGEVPEGETVITENFFVEDVEG